MNESERMSVLKRRVSMSEGRVCECMDSSSLRSSHWMTTSLLLSYIRIQTKKREELSKIPSLAGEIPTVNSQMSLWKRNE